MISEKSSTIEGALRAVDDVAYRRCVSRWARAAGVASTRPQRLRTGRKNQTTGNPLSSVRQIHWAPGKCSLGANSITRRSRLSAHNSHPTLAGFTKCAATPPGGVGFLDSIDGVDCIDCIDGGRNGQC